MCDDILDDYTEQDDWNFQYSCLDDKPSKMSSNDDKTPERQCTDESPVYYYHPTSGNRSLTTDPTVMEPRSHKRSFDQKSTSSMSPEILRIQKGKDFSRSQNDLPERLTHKPSFSFSDKPRPIRDQFQRNSSTMLPSSNQLKGNNFVTASHVAATTKNQYQPSAIELYDNQSWSYEKDGLVSSAMKNQQKKGTREERMEMDRNYGTGETTQGNRDTSCQRPAVSNIMKKQSIQPTEQWRPMQVNEKISKPRSKPEVTTGQARAKEISGSLNSTVPTSFVKRYTFVVF